MISVGVESGDRHSLTSGGVWREVGEQIISHNANRQRCEEGEAYSGPSLEGGFVCRRSG